MPSEAGRKSQAASMRPSATAAGMKTRVSRRIRRCNASMTARVSPAETGSQGIPSAGRTTNAVTASDTKSATIVAGAALTR